MKKLLVILIILSMFAFVGCGSADKGDDTSATTAGSIAVESEGTAVTTVPVESLDNVGTTPVVLSAEELYNAYLGKLCDKLRNIIVDDTHLDGFADQEGMLGISEYAVSGDVDMLKKMGYLIQDLNGDGTDEMFIFQVDEPGSDPCTGGRILCAYTVSEGNMLLLFEGNSKNRYYLLEDGSIYNECSESAARLGFGLYRLPTDGTALECMEFNFVDYLDEETINCYRNLSGQFDIDGSELLEEGKTAYDTKQLECVERIQKVELTAFEAFGG